MKKTSTKQIRTKRIHEIKQQFCDEDGRFKQNGDYFLKRSGPIIRSLPKSKPCHRG